MSTYNIEINYGLSKIILPRNVANLEDAKIDIDNFIKKIIFSHPAYITEELENEGRVSLHTSRLLTSSISLKIIDTP